MCGRYTLHGPRSRLYEQFDPGFAEISELPRDIAWFNVAPSQHMPVVRASADGGREIVSAQWGLRPSWASAGGKMPQPINARIETAAERPMFRHAFRRSRVLVPASGFYEWQVVAGRKQPYYIRPAGDELFGFAGLLERWQGPDGELLSFAILTTAANDTVAPIHDRMPVIVCRDDYAAWLDSAITDPELVREIASGYPAEAMRSCPVRSAVGNPRAQGPQLIEPVGVTRPA